MNAPRPTKIGDVLILRSRESYTVYAVGSVKTAGQEDFSHADDTLHVRTEADAVAIAKDFVARGGRIYLFDIGTDEWADITTES